MATKFDAQIESVEASASGDHHEPLTQRGNDSGDEDDDARAFKEWVALRRSLRIVVTGKTGAGKSTLLNGYIGGKTRPFKEGDGFDPERLEVEQHTFMKHNVEVTIWYCSGLQDGIENEEAYLEDLKNKTNGDIDVMLYCISMEEIQFDPQCHGAAMEHLTEAFGCHIWRQTVIVLTFANKEVRRLKIRQSNVDKAFERKVMEWKTKILDTLRKISCIKKPLDSDIKQIQVVPAGFKTPSLPGRKFWLSNVWISIFVTLKTDEAKAAAVALNEHRFRSGPEQKYPSIFTYIASPWHRRSSAAEVERPPTVTDDDFKNQDQPIVITPGIGSVEIGTPVGAGVGGLISGGIGFIMSSLFPAYKHHKAASERDKAATSGVTPDGQTDIAGICESYDNIELPAPDLIANESAIATSKQTKAAASCVKLDCPTDATDDDFVYTNLLHNIQKIHKVAIL